MERLRARLRDRFGRGAAPVLPVAESRFGAALRTRPGQEDDARMYAWASGPRSDDLLAMFAYNNWVYSAVSRMADEAASAEFMVRPIDDLIQPLEHPLTDLLGLHGVPNDYQDSSEFWAMHFSQLDLVGNVYWYWYSKTGMGAPTEVHLLEPNEVQVIPGRSQGVAGYRYQHEGKIHHIHPDYITHFKGINPRDVYYGMGALECLRIEISSDRSMSLWNNKFFGDDVAIPAGILTVPDDVTDAQMQELDTKLNARHGFGQRRTAILKSQPGGIAYYPAGVAPRDMDFTNGRLLSRRAVYEALQLPLGLMSEASTEAHARVAERQLAAAVRRRHMRTCRKLIRDALPFWEGPRTWKQRVCDFEDLGQRAADWDRESKRLAAVGKYMSVDEVRTRILRLPAAGEGFQSADSTSSQSRGAAGGRGDRPVSGDRQAENVVGREK